MTNLNEGFCHLDRLATLLLQAPANARAEILQSAASFRPVEDIDADLDVAPVRAAFADAWEGRFTAAVPILALCHVLEPPVSIDVVSRAIGRGAAVAPVSA